MSALAVASIEQLAEKGSSADASPPVSVAFHYRQTDSLVALLQQLGASLLISTYQANKLLAVRASGQGLSTLVRTFDRPMGLAVNERRLAIGTRKEVWLLRIAPAGSHDACFVPRSSHVTGDIGIHEIAWAGEELWMVSTRFSCLCTLSPDYSFVPRWRPPFVTALSAEDRCHLNGLAIVDGQPAYVSALGATDTPGGWRADKSHGGCIVDVPTREIVTRGLSMPHSPRWHNEQLWVLESGTGGVTLVDRTTGRHETVCELPGFTRGWAMVGPYAFVGLSKIRPTSAMDGVPIAERRDELRSGIAAIDLQNGQLIGLLEFQTAVEEIFDVQLLPGLRFPEVIGFQQETIQHTFIVPPENGDSATIG